MSEETELRERAEGRIGTVLHGKYRVDAVLGIGGMGAVFATTHRNQKRFAVKILHPELSLRSDIRRRFVREGYVANSLEHPGAVAILDDDVAEDGAAFLVMELLEGATVERVWEATLHPIPPSAVLAIAHQLLDTLAAAHAKSVVHRDIKPANLFLQRDGAVKVLDFGIARVRDATAASMTNSGALLGTPAFMAPEQASGETSQIGGETDVWAVGATMFTLLSGKFVRVASSGQQMIIEAATRPARSLASVRPDLPLRLVEMVDKALAFDKRERGSAAAMREAVARAHEELYGAPVSRAPLAALVAEHEARVKTKAGELASGGSAVIAAKGATPGSGPLSPLAATQEPVSERYAGGTTAQSVSKPASRTDKTSRRVVPWRRLTVGALACAAVAGGVTAYRAARGPHVHYCLRYEITQGGPRCLFEVGADTVRSRVEPTFRITERGGGVSQVEQINFAGGYQTSYGGLARIEVVRDDAGAVRELLAFDPFGRNLAREKWSEGGRRIDYVDLDGKTPRHVDHGDFGNANAKDRATTLRVEYDAEGRRKRVLFFGPTGRPRAANSTVIDERRASRGGVYGVELEYGTTSGIAVKQTNLGYDGAPAPNTAGVVFARQIDDAAPWGDITFFDVNDRPIAPRGVHTEHFVHDDYQPTGRASLGLHGEPSIDLDLGYQSTRMFWDPVKRTLEWEAFDERGRPRVSRDQWVLLLRFTFDARGRLITSESMDAQGNPATTRAGVSITRMAYDDTDHLTRYETFDRSGRPTETEQGYARLENKTNAHGMPIEDWGYDAEGHLVPDNDGIEGARSTYDEHDLQLTWTGFDATEHPVACVDGYATRRTKWDRHRNLVEKAYFGPDGRPTSSNEGYSTKRAEYDDDDDRVAVSYFDASGAPTPFQSSYATQRFKNDERGLVIEESYFDIHGDPVLVKDGYATVKNVRNRNGDVVGETYLGKHGEPVLREGGFARRTTLFDVTRHPIEVALFDVAGQPVRGAAGWAIERTTYDDRGLVIRLDHLDAERHPVIDRDGRASMVQVNDPGGMPVETTSLDVAGKPVTTPDGYATKKTTYDHRDEVIEEALFGAGGEPVSGNAGWSLRRVRYDDSGNVLEEAFFGPTREAVAPKGQLHASMRQRFDDRHKLVESTYLDVRGAPSKGPDGVATVSYVRDGYGRATETRYFDGMRVPAPSQDGKMVVRSKYDTAGRVVAERFTGASGAPRAAADGCSGHETKYDAKGHPLEEVCKDGNDAPTLSTDGWAIRRTLHDAHGNAVEVATYASDGALHADKEGIAHRKSRFGERNELLETTYFDASDKPTRDKSGAHALRFTYDDSGKKTGESAFDERDRPVPPKPTAQPR